MKNTRSTPGAMASASASATTAVDNAASEERLREGDPGFEEALRAHVYSKRYMPSNAGGTRAVLLTLIPHVLLSIGFPMLSQTTLGIVAYTLLRAGLFLRTFMLFHDAGHGSLFKSKIANRISLWPLSVLVLTPIDWVGKHKRHHMAAGHLNSENGPWSDTVFATSQSRAAMNPFARSLMDFFRWPPVFFTAVPALVWFMRYRLPIQYYAGRFALSPANIANTASVAAFLYTIRTFLGPEAIVCELVAAYLGAAVGILLFHVQHVYNPEGDDDEKAYVVTEGWSARDAGMKGSSHLLVTNPVLRYFTLGIEYHHLHHQNVRVPGYKLRQCHEEAPAGLFDSVTTLDASGTWKSLGNTLYNEDSGRYQ